MKYTKSRLIKKINRSLDNRGFISSIVDDKIQNISIIFSKKNSIRSNHYHKKDFHYMFVLSGEMHYFYSEINSDKINHKLIKKNEVIFTPSKDVHLSFFPKNTTLLVASGFPRDKKTYEKDTVRLELLNRYEINKFLSKYS